MVNFLNASNSNLAKKIECLKTVEEKNVAILAIAFQIFKMVTTKEDIAGTNDPLYRSLVKDIAYDVNELVIINVDQVLIYADKFLELKNFRFDSNLDGSSSVGELFGVDKILGNSIVEMWNANFILFKEISDLYFISDIHDTSLKALESKSNEVEPDNQPLAELRV